MAILKCKMCGGELHIEDGSTVCECEYCGTKQTVPKLDSEKKINLYDRANHLRRNNDYDKAMGIYEQILNEDNTDAEAYWSLVLCRYGIEYVEDPATRKRIPTVNRAQYTSIYADENYKSALQYASIEQKILYEQEAKTIDEIQKGILAISEKEEPFDVFICYKETDDSGRRTQDSVLANDLYHQLVQEGFKVFFARITLEDKLGQEYEPYIFAALNSAKVMVVLGTRPEYFKAVWVKNEWSRFLALIKKDSKKTLIPAYRDMDPYDLPEEFSHLQAQDMSKLGFMQDLIRGIKKMAYTESKKKVIINENTSLNVGVVTPLLKRVFIFLEDGEWKNADDYCEKVLDLDPENAEAYLGKMMAELKTHNREELAINVEPIDGNNHYKKILKYGDEKIINEVTGYAKNINERIESEKRERQLEVTYKKLSDKLADKELKKQIDITNLSELISGFEQLGNYKESENIVRRLKEEYERLSYRFAHEEEIIREEILRFLEQNPEAKTSMELALVNGNHYVVQRIDKICKELVEQGQLKIIRNEDDDVAYVSEKRVADFKGKEQEKIYKDALFEINNGNSVNDFYRAVSLLQKIEGYKDSAKLIENCKNKINKIEFELQEAERQKAEYDAAVKRVNEEIREEISKCENNILSKSEEIKKSLISEMNDTIQQNNIEKSRLEEKKGILEKEKEKLVIFKVKQRTELTNQINEINFQIKNCKSEQIIRQEYLTKINSVDSEVKNKIKESEEQIKSNYRMPKYEDFVK